MTHTWASASASTLRHLDRLAVDERTEALRPPTSAGPSPGADTTPTTGPCSTWVSAMSVAHTGMPRTKLLVPSIGSMTHRHGTVGVADRGRAPRRTRRARGRCASDGVADRRLGVAVGLGDLGAVRLPVEVERPVGRSAAA